MPIDYSVFTDSELDAIEKQDWKALSDVKLNYLEAGLKAESSGKPQEEVMSTWDAFSRQFERAATAVPRALKKGTDWLEEKILTPEQRQQWAEFGGRNEDANSPPPFEAYDKQAESESRIAMEEQPAVSMAGFLAGNIVDPSNLIPFNAVSKLAKGAGPIVKGILGGSAAGAVGGALDPNYEEYGDNWKTSAMKVGGGLLLGGIVGGVMGKFFPEVAGDATKALDDAPRAPDEMMGPPSAMERVGMVEDRGTPAFKGDPYSDALPTPPERVRPVDPNDPYAFDAKLAEEAAQRAERATGFPEPLAKSNRPADAALLRPDDDYAKALAQKAEQDKILEEANRILVKQAPEQQESAISAAFKKAGFQPKPEEVDTGHLHSRSLFDDDITRAGMNGERLGAFTTREAAQAAMENKGLKDSHVLAPVEDGFVLRPIKTRTEAEVRGVKMSDPEKIEVVELGYKMGKAEPEKLKLDIEARAKKTGQTPVEVSREAITAKRVHSFMAENSIPEPKDELEAADLLIKWNAANPGKDC